MMKIDKSLGRVLYPALFFILSIVIAYSVYIIVSPSEKIKVKTFEVSGGWGYQIVVNNKVFIEQPFIPVLAGKKPFPDKKSAARAGDLVRDRLVNHLRPAFTTHDLEKIGLDSSGNLK